MSTSHLSARRKASVSSHGTAAGMCDPSRHAADFNIYHLPCGMRLENVIPCLSLSKKKSSNRQKKKIKNILSVA